MQRAPAIAGFSETRLIPSFCVLNLVSRKATLPHRTQSQKSCESTETFTLRKLDVAHRNAGVACSSMLLRAVVDSKSEACSQPYTLDAQVRNPGQRIPQHKHQKACTPDRAGIGEGSSAAGRCAMSGFGVIRFACQHPTSTSKPQEGSL